jgi:hypothetical protein
VDTAKTISDRQATHGDFRDVGKMSESLLEVCYRSKNWGSLEPYKREGLKMILHKIARILSGNSDFEDHWIDVSGYAERVRIIIQEDSQITEG